ncbi:MAG TPA: hypothetical protein PKO15_07900 [Fibrobacteria bacterium]|nr:hypothetical protein [Fibrobacteria bacterium]HOX50828.1 hypothetical protein [Fibrobacteria bacterium]
MRNLAALIGLLGSTVAFGLDRDTETWSVDANLRLGWVDNEFLSQDEDFYASIPLVIRDEKGRTERLKVSTDPAGLELVVLRAIDEDWRLGAGLGYLRSESYVSNGLPDDPAEPFLEQYCASLRGRWLPWTESIKSGGTIRMEVDAGLGGSMGTLHRFALAGDLIASKPDSISAPVREAFRRGEPEQDLWGIHADAQVNVARQWESGVRLGAGLGLSYQHLWLDSDPLWGTNLGGTRFEDQANEYGIVFKLFAGWAF